MTEHGVFLSVCTQVSSGMLLIAMAMLLWRLAKGPTAADRIIALDLLSVLVVAFLVVISLYSMHTTYLDVAIAYACIAFLGTVALVRFIYKKGRYKSRPNGDEKPDSGKGGFHG